MKDINEVQKSLKKIKSSDVNDLLIRSSVRKGEVLDNFKTNQVKSAYGDKKWKMQDALDETVKDIIKRDDPEIEEQLASAFSEFSSALIKIIMSAKSDLKESFEDEENRDIVELKPSF